MEYIILRLIRKFLFTEKFLYKFGKYIPYYKPSNNEIDPQPIIDKYSLYLGMKNKTIKGSIILDVGSGSTNSIGYCLLKKGARSVTLYEPYAIFDEALDEKVITNIQIEKIELNRLKRTDSIKDLKKEFDFILSHSVLEHVENPHELFSNLLSLLKDGGSMIHIADFRDHFFKYPYNFLKYSKSIWNIFLNPGDLPRWRKYDFEKIFQELNIKFEVLFESSDPENFEIIKKQIHRDFDIKNKDLSIGYCVFFLKK